MKNCVQNLKFIAVGCGLMAVAGGISSAKADFEWRGLPPAGIVQETTVTEVLPMPIGDGPTALAVPVAPVTAVEQVTTTTASNGPVAVTTTPIAVVDDNYRGFGRDIPLGVAVRQIVPKNMDVIYENAEDINMSANVSWTGDGNWRTTLDKILMTHGLVTSIRGDDVVIRPEMTAVPMPMAAIHQTSAPIGVSQKVVTVAPQPVMAAAWSANPGETLRDVLAKWSAKANTTLSWATDYNYRLNHAASFNGSYEAAVEGLLDQFRKVEPRPYGELAKSATGGRVLVIRVYGEN